MAGDGGWYDGTYRELSKVAPVQVVAWGAPKAAFFANFSDKDIQLAEMNGERVRFTAVFAPEPDRLVRCVLDDVDYADAADLAFEELNALAKTGARASFEGESPCQPIAGWS